MSTDPLSQLRDIHMPSGVNWWPPALGWWLLLLVLLSGSVLLFRFLYLLWQRRKQQAKALAQVRQLQRQHQDDDRILLQALSRLLRQLALHYYGRNKLAGLTGRSWLEFLDESGQTMEFTQGVGQAFAELPYTTKPITQITALCALVRLWIKKQPYVVREQQHV